MFKIQLEEEVKEQTTMAIDNQGFFTGNLNFNSKETWTIQMKWEIPHFLRSLFWFNRFKDVAYRQGWDDQQKLNFELVPKIQHPDGEFVYDQVPTKTRYNYKALVKELEYRLRKVEKYRNFK